MACPHSLVWGSNKIVSSGKLFKFINIEEGAFKQLSDDD